MLKSQSKVADELHEPFESLGNEENNITIYSPAPPILALSLLTIPSPPGSPYWTPEHSPKSQLELVPEESPILSSEEGDPEQFLAERLYEPLKGLSPTPLSVAPDDYPQYLPTSCSAIDIALHGGFSYRLINSLSSEHSAERTLIAMHAVTSHLILYPHTKAIWVDTGGTFSVTHLKSVVTSRVDRLGLDVESVLDRVQIERVVDMQGLFEVLDEFKEKGRGDLKEKMEIERQVGGGVINDSQEYSREEENRDRGPKEKVINDSQEYCGDSEDEDSKKRKDWERNADSSAYIGVVVVDTITHLLSEMKFIDPGESEGTEKDIFETEDYWSEIDKPETTALFVHFCRSFSLIAKDRKTCLLLLNDTTPVPDDEDYYMRSHELPASQFYTFPGTKPSLGPVYTEYIDLSILLTKQPPDIIMAPEEPRLGFDDPGFTIPKKKRLQNSPEELKIERQVWESMHKNEWVIEVIWDRYGGRGGAWGVFSVEDVRLVGVLYDRETEFLL